MSMLFTFRIIHFAVGDVELYTWQAIEKQKTDLSSQWSCRVYFLLQASSFKVCDNERALYEPNLVEL